ncbi:uncharacterized protein MONOS_9855 [Monocercomonoides exilis]|uniref:uncharacterized protein n=1 Tax=Monocercomonoides exilis TaxID=2049356 RepID=UPI0035598580|nr:hypothetical protein MONOS_9855 [Monocercomonoides exilis]|eukprot:MONOS_9855.1-p1 / transcript=MONOS_9855.1 / gene=MONOS_9855 / organism=Monocercomonoides_exilis_PA203 / gene_product=unspecified product / transcript_product=unspecified product / location=Mono_scaffold00423:6270-6812(-) / protein_length=100 / sequence_SO=supercontig / SO=protein_coding / is_pseudo=false
MQDSASRFSVASAEQPQSSPTILDVHKSLRAHLPTCFWFHFARLRLSSIHPHCYYLGANMSHCVFINSQWSESTNARSSDLKPSCLTLSRAADELKDCG